MTLSMALRVLGIQIKGYSLHTFSFQAQRPVIMISCKRLLAGDPSFSTSGSSKHFCKPKSHESTPHR